MARYLIAAAAAILASLALSACTPHTFPLAIGAAPGGADSAGSPWGSPVQLAASGGEPAIAVDAMGRALVAWRHAATIWARTLSANRWSDPVSLSTAATSAPSVAFAAASAWVAWAQPDRGADRIAVRRFDPVHGWEPARIISGQEYTEPASASQPTIASDESGRVIAAWIQPRDVGAPPFMWSSDYAPGDDWSAPHLFASGPWAQTPVLAMDGKGNAVASWIAEGEAFHSVRVVENSGRSGWGRVVLPWGRRDALDWTPHAAINAKGDGIVAWSHRRCCTLGTDIYASHRQRNGWTEPRRVEWSESEPSNAPQVAVDAAGDGIAVWRQGEAGAGAIWAARYRAGDRWMPARRLRQASGDTGAPQLALAKNGDMVVVWTQNNALWLARTHGGAWSFDSLAAERPSHVRVAAGAASGVFVVWQQADGIWFAQIH